MKSPIVTTMKQSMQVLTSMNTGRWFTPPWYIEMIKEVFQGRIELDPASEYQANKIVHAITYFTEKENGLTLPWKADNVFLNPPYSKEGERKATTPKWTQKALNEYSLGNYSQGIILVNAKLGYNWFTECIDDPNTTVMLHRKRTGFIDAKTLEISKPSRQPQASIFIGESNQLFVKVFSKLGWIINQS